MSKQRINKIRPSKTRPLKELSFDAITQSSKDNSFDDRVKEYIETICENVEVTIAFEKKYYYQYIPADISASVIDIITDANGCGYRAEQFAESVINKEILCNKYKIFV